MPHQREPRVVIGEGWDLVAASDKRVNLHLKSESAYDFGAKFCSALDFGSNFAPPFESGL